MRSSNAARSAPPASRRGEDELGVLVEVTERTRVDHDALTQRRLVGGLIDAGAREHGPTDDRRLPVVAGAVSVTRSPMRSPCRRIVVAPRAISSIRPGPAQR